MAWYLSYQDYLRSPLFKAARDLEMLNASGKCRKCGAYATEVHHRDAKKKTTGYPPWGCWETSENLESICHECHCKEHGK